jgi:hypothetical protein
MLTLLNSSTDSDFSRKYGCSRLETSVVEGL